MLAHADYRRRAVLGTRNNVISLHAPALLNTNRGDKALEAIATVLTGDYSMLHILRLHLTIRVRIVQW